MKILHIQKGIIYYLKIQSQNSFKFMVKNNKYLKILLLLKDLDIKGIKMNLMRLKMIGIH